LSVYLVTGFTGSLGSVITRKLLAEGHKVRGVARGEHRIEELIRSVPDVDRPRLSPFVGDVRDRWRLWRATQDVDFVIHAAALKGIGRCEYDPEEAIKTNIEGTAAVINASLDCGVKRAVFISSDKACAPHNLYGMTKATAERAWLAANRYSAGHGTKFVAVRYGNVWGSNGSVARIWEKQRALGHLLTISDPQCTRFHFRLPDAVDFVLKALLEAYPGSLWIPVLPSYRLGDLLLAYDARESIVTGIGVGEKRHESMLSEHEGWYSKLEDQHYVMDPRTRQATTSGPYTSGGNTWRLTVDQLKGEIRWLTESSSSPNAAPAGGSGRNPSISPTPSV